jgi:hypothetical protein
MHSVAVERKQIDGEVCVENGPLAPTASTSSSKYRLICLSIISQGAEKVTPEGSTS